MDLDQPAGKQYTYGPVLPGATYSPWLADQEFNNLYAGTNGASLVDILRTWDLWKLVEQTSKLPEGDFLEVGVWRGGTGAVIAKRALECSPDSKVYLCDTFAGVVKITDKDPFYQFVTDPNGLHICAKDSVEQLIQHHALTNAVVLEGVMPEDTGHLIENKRFKFCHIDVDVYQSAEDVMEWLWPRLIVGGVVVYDDYGFCFCPGITEHVEKQAHLDDRLVIHNLNGHAIIVKIK